MAYGIIPAPLTQGLKCSTFTQHALDGSLSLAALYDWQAVHSSDHPLFVFEESPGTHRTIKWAEAIKGIQRATRILRNAVMPSTGATNGVKSPIVGVLALAGEYTYFKANLPLIILRRHYHLLLLHHRRNKVWLYSFPSVYSELRCCHKIPSRDCGRIALIRVF